MYPKSTPKRDKPYSVSSKTFYLNKNYGTAHWAYYFKLKYLDINDLLKIKQTNKKMEAELTEMDSRTENLAVSEEANVDQAIPKKPQKHIKKKWAKVLITFTLMNL